MRIWTWFAALALGSNIWAAPQDHPAHESKIAVFGTLHAHSHLSGDVSSSKGFSPLEAFTYARDQGLDFLGISDHHKPATAPSQEAKNGKDDSVCTRSELQAVRT